MKALVGQGHHVDVIDRSSRTSCDHISNHIVGSLTDVDATRAAFEGADVVFHVAANPNVSISVNEPLTDFALNAQATAVALEAARLADVKRFVFVSSALVYGRNPVLPLIESAVLLPLVPYAAGKIAGENYCRVYHECYGLEAITARVFCVYGPGRNARTSMVEVPRYLRWHLQKKPIQLVGDPKLKTRDYIHVEDVVRGLILISENGNPGSIYNIGSGEETSMSDLIELIGEITGRTPIIDAFPQVLDDTFRQVADTGCVSSIGFRPQWTLRTGVTALVDELGDDPDDPLGEVVLSSRRALSNSGKVG